MFRAAPFVTAHTWKQSKHSAVDKWIGTLWYSHEIEGIHAYDNLSDS